MSQIGFTCTVSPTLPLQIAEHWNTYCIPIVLHQFSASVDGNRTFGYFDFLPDLYRESSDSSCLYSATNAIAEAYITNLSHAIRDKKELMQTHGRALRSMNAALEDPLERAKDSTIIAVWLLGIYEVLGYRACMAYIPFYAYQRLTICPSFWSIRQRNFQRRHQRHITCTLKVSHLCFMSEAHPSSLLEEVVTSSG